MKPHLVYLAFWFPPSRASGVYRAIATARVFFERGWDVTVITTTQQFLEDEVGAVDLSLLDLVPDGVGVIRVPFSFGRVTAPRDLRDLGWLRANFPHVGNRIRVALSPVISAANILRGRSPDTYQMSDNYVAWIDPVVNRGRSLWSQRPFQHILATGNPFSSFEAARILSGLTGAPFSVDYRDPWTIDVFTGKSDVVDRLTAEAERRILAEASHAFHVNEAIARAYGEKYGETRGKHHVVFNGYDIASIPPRPRLHDGGPLTFGILGTVNDRWPLTAIIEGWISGRPDLPEGSRLLLAGHLGYFERSRDLIEASLPDETVGFEYVGPVSKADVASFYSQLDVVIVPVPGGELVTSGKIFEALAVGCPLVCVQAVGGGARELISGHHMAFAAEPEPSDVRRALREAAAAASQKTETDWQIIRDQALPYERTSAVGAMIEAIAGAAERAS